VDNLRKYGHKPFRVAVIHGGPGAPGELAPVARELCSDMGILEPLQTTGTVDGQVEELKSTLENSGNPPLILVGFSWGAWLSYIFAARYPLLVKKLVLIGSAPFEEKYAAGIMETRLSRLGEEEKKEAVSLSVALDYNTFDDTAFSRFVKLLDKADFYDPLPHDGEVLAFNPDIYSCVWGQASELRASGELLKLGERLQCPVIAIHGDYDPHPAEGVKVPLSRVVKDLRFILLKKCGHRPWLERNARDRFYGILRSEIGSFNLRETEYSA
jgi:pimeloyl-ACP methyl ester carboxylesterase